MHSVRELITLSSDFLSKKGVINARREAEELLAFLLKKKRLELYKARTTIITTLLAKYPAGNGAFTTVEKLVL